MIAYDRQTAALVKEWEAQRPCRGALYGADAQKMVPALKERYRQS